MARLTGHTGLVYSVAFSSDGLLLASASGDRTVRVWEVAAAKCVAVLTGHTDEVFTAAFHPDGKRLASAGRDRAILAVGPVDRRRGRSPGGDTQTTSSRWLLARTARRWCLVPATVRSGSGTPSRRRGAIRPVVKLRPCGPRPTGWWIRCGGKERPGRGRGCTRGQRCLSEPLRRAALGELLAEGSSATCRPKQPARTRPDSKDDANTGQVLHFSAAAEETLNVA